jgi:hypothetical protein
MVEFSFSYFDKDCLKNNRIEKDPCKKDIVYEQPYESQKVHFTPCYLF